MKRRIVKRTLALILTLVMLLGVVPMAGAAAATAEETAQVSESAPAAQSEETSYSGYELWGDFNAGSEPLAFVLNEDGMSATCTVWLSAGKHMFSLFDSGGINYRNAYCPTDGMTDYSLLSTWWADDPITIETSKCGVYTFNLLFEFCYFVSGSAGVMLKIVRESGYEEIPDCYVGAEPTEDGFNYVVYNGEAYIDSYVGEATNVVVPEEIDGYPVVGIGSDAFEESVAESIELPSTLRSIGASAFAQMLNLTSITLPEGVQSVGVQAFYGCTYLSDVNFPNTITRAGADIFDETAYSNNGENWTGDVLYAGSVLISARYKNELIASYGDVYVKPGTKAIADYAFCNVIDLGGLITTETRGRASIDHLDIPEGVVYIGHHAFYRSKSIKSVTLPSTIKTIYGYTFADCDVMYSPIIIPEGVTYIGRNAFHKCKFKDLGTSEWIRLPGTLETIDGYAFDESGFNGDLTLPKSCKWIRNYAFNVCVDLSSVVLTGVEIIGNHAFAGCDSLERVEIASSLKILGSYAFASNEISIRDVNGSYSKTVYNNLKEIVLPQGVKEIGDSAFRNCKSLESINLPEGLEYIGDKAFSNCESLKSIVLPNSLIQAGTSINSDNYTSASVNSLFYNCISLESITFPQEPKFSKIDISFGTVDKRNNENLKELDIPEGITHLQLDNTYGLETLKFPKSLEYLYGASTNRSARDVYYNGTQAQWDNIKMRETHDGYYEHYTFEERFPNATLHILGNQVTWSKGEHYEVVPHDDSVVLDGNSFSFSVNTSEGYKLVSVVSNMKEMTPGEDGVYTIENITEDTSIIVIVEKDPFVYDVTFTDRDGNVLSTQKVYHGMAAEAPEAPVVSSYAFLGWSEDFSRVTGDMTIYPLYDYHPGVYLMGGFNNWSKVSPMEAPSGSKDYSYIVNLDKGSYEFKIVIVNDNGSDVWYGNDGNINDVTTTGWVFETRLGNCTLVAQGGTYEFKFNIDSKKLEVSRVPDVTVTFTD